MNRTVLDLWVGFFVAIGIAALLFLALKVGNLSSAHLSETYVLQAKFDNIGGLNVRGPVKSAGVVVGRVTDIQFDPATYEAVVTMSIDGRYRFPKDTFASILTAGLLGEQYIGFDAGGDDKILWLLLLEHEPLHLHIVLGMAPVAPGIKVAEKECFLQAQLDPGNILFLRAHDEVKRLRGGPADTDHQDPFGARVQRAGVTDPFLVCESPDRIDHVVRSDAFFFVDRKDPFDVSH